MSDLVEFLLARIAEDEEAALTANPAAIARPDGVFPDSEPNQYARVPTTGGVRISDVLTSVRVLAECEAKRKIIELHNHTDDSQPCWEMHRGIYGPGWPESSYAAEGESWAHPSLEYVPERRDPCDTLRWLALPYASHPDYFEQWRP